MEIKYNKDKSVTINATELEYSAICSAIIQTYQQVEMKPLGCFYKPMMDAMNNAYKEHVLGEGK